MESHLSVVVIVLGIFLGDEGCNRTKKLHVDCMVIEYECLLRYDMCRVASVLQVN